jgi:hypothetical protein
MLGPGLVRIVIERIEIPGGDGLGKGVPNGRQINIRLPSPHARLVEVEPN